MKFKLNPTSLILSTLIGSGALAACADAADYSYDTSVHQFMEAERQKSNSGAMYQYEQSMQGTLFGMYPTYWRLDSDLSAQSPNAINAFVRQYPSNVMSEKLAADYAETKAREGDYASVRAVAGSIENADASEACAIGLGFNQIGDARALNQKPEVWLNTTIRQTLCDKLASEMASNPRITRTDRHEQLIRMMRIDRRQLSSRQSPTDKSSDIIHLARSLNMPIDYGILSNIRANPNGFFTQFGAQPYNELNQYLYVYAISQLAHRSYWQAQQQLSYDINADNARPQKLLSDMAKRYAWRSIAVKRMNMNTDDGFNIEAVNWFRNSRGEPFNFEEAEDYAQVSIYFGQWQDVVFAIESMSFEKRSERIWQYWLARAYEQTGKQPQARQIYSTLAHQLDYYGLLAKDRLGQRLTITDIGGGQIPTISTYDAQRVMQDQNFARAFLLMQNNASTEHIQREWNWAVRDANKKGDSALIIAAAKRAHDLGVYNRSIYAIEYLHENQPAFKVASLSHPIPPVYHNSFIGHSRSAGIDPAWALGITHKESRFQSSARSSVGAGGLMQIMPATANMIARKIGSSGSATSPDTNIRYGTWYLSDKAREFNGQIAAATAAYNAGSSPVKKWLPKSGSMSADQFVEAIPYFETRDYVKQVMTNATIYSTLMGQPIPISQRMGTVSPSW